MWKHQIQIAFRNLIKRKQITLINLLGLSIGLTIFILISLYLDHQWNHDSFQEKRNNIYRYEVVANSGYTSGAMAGFLAEKHPEVEKYTRILEQYPSLKTEIDGEVREILTNEILLADPMVTEIFTFDFLLGNPSEAIASKNEIAISESLAHKLFGDNSPLGQTIYYESEHEFIVSGVYKDWPSNSMIPADALINFEVLNTFWGKGAAETWEQWCCDTFFLLNPKADIEKLTLQMEKEINAAYEIEPDSPNWFTSKLELFPNIYFADKQDKWYHGSKTNLRIFSAISLFILLIACVNFINISTAYAGQRAKEIGLKKAVGAAKRHIRRQFLIETYFLSYLAIIIAITLTELLLPFYSQLIGRELSLIYTTRNLLILLIILPSLLALLAGFYPSIILSSFNVINVLKGQYTKGKTNGTFRKALTVFQFSIGIFLVIATLGLYTQLQFIQKMNPGYQKEHLVYLPSNKKMDKQFETFADQLTSNPNIKGITRMNSSLINLQDGQGLQFKDNPEKTHIYNNFIADFNFVEIAGLEILEGRDFIKGDADRDKCILINETLAKKHFPQGDAIGEMVRNWKIIGIVKDFNFKSLHNTIEPLIIVYSHNKVSTIAVRLTGSQIKGTLNFIRQKWEQMAPDYPFEYEFSEEKFERLYHDDKQFLKLFLIFSGLAIFLACLGLFAMASFIAERKTKEIGVRKVLGAPIENIILMLSKEFTQWVMIANLIAWPAAWYFLNEWLNNFAYRIEIQWNFFLIGAMFALFIALLTILSHTLKTARKNPVESLKYE
ncbi:MAG: ABC transporter permease [Marinifilaceae bacterium]